MQRTAIAVICLAATLSCPHRVRAAADPGIDLDAFDRGMHEALLPDGIKLAYADLGPRDGKPVVLIHGYTNDARNWAPLIPRLEAGLRLILVDMRGHGRSSKPDCCYCTVDMAYDIVLLLDRLGIKSADVVGHSLGSLVAQALAEHWPDRVGRVVLISSSGGIRPGCAAAGPAAPPLPWLRARLVALHDPIDPNSRFITDWYGTPPPDSELLRRQKRDAAAIPVKIWLALLDQAVTGIDLQSTLMWLRAPTLLIWGAKDALIDEPLRCALREGLPGAQVKVFPDYGHNPFWEDPAAVAAVINPFLSGN